MNVLECLLGIEQLMWPTLKLRLSFKIIYICLSNRPYLYTLVFDFKAFSVGVGEISRSFRG